MKITELQGKINERGKVKYDLVHLNCWEFAGGLAIDIVDLCLSDAAHASARDKGIRFPCDWKGKTKRSRTSYAL